MNKNDLSAKAPSLRRGATAEVNYLKSIELLGEQIKQSYNEALKLKLLANYKQVNKVVVGGMGGSQLGADLINSLFKQELKVPIIQVRDYSLPGFVDDKTLVLLISYSGTTEEVLEISSKLKAKSLKPIVITVGGKLAQTAQKNHWPLYQFNPVNNPSGQPRMGTGYTIGSVLAILQKLNLIKLNGNEILEMIKSAKLAQSLKLKAQSLANSLKNKVPIIVTAEHLVGNAHIIANQINESAKQQCYFYVLPELNHHLLEGLKFPALSRNNLYFLFFFSKDYYARNQRRFAVTAEVLAKQKIKHQQINLSGSKIEQALSLLTLGSLLSFGLAKINKVNPNYIPWVDYFKKRLTN
ncbi:MAG: SIS domain-containing protein [Candidatus Komeilibacteria bacterium]|nr:SIS domain-containing protein [Candidatus Komeilibacteria bacterium]